MAVDREFYNESEGLGTTLDLQSVFGTSAVQVGRDDDLVQLSINLGGGEVTASMVPDRAAQLGEALIEASESMDQPESGGDRDE